jgi:hypothetical protein
VRGDRGHLRPQPGLVDRAEQEAHGQQPLLLEVPDQPADLAGDADRTGGAGRALRLLHPVEHDGDGEPDHGQERYGDQQTQLAAYPQPTE